MCLNVHVIYCHNATEHVYVQIYSQTLDLAVTRYEKFINSIHLIRQSECH